MARKIDDAFIENWSVNKIGVIGPGIVGMPMAAMLAHARITIGTENPAQVTVVQRDSVSSGWKVDAINTGKSVIGGIEPGLDKIVMESVEEGLLSATHNPEDISDADVILVCVQTDKKGFEPDYGPMFGALTSLAEALQNKPEHTLPLIIFESTLAPSSMATLMKDHFASYGLMEGEDILLGNSPNRVMPGRLVERVAGSDKLVAGLHPVTPQLIKILYSHIVTEGELYPTNSLSAEIEKTFENAYRDVRIAYTTEVVRYCDENNINFYSLRDQVNVQLAQQDDASEDPNAVPTGGLLIPTLGVGGHCLPKDGILLWWRKIEAGADTSRSLILGSRHINDASPEVTFNMAEKVFGELSGKKIALLGAAYRFNSEDTRNSPTLVLAKQLLGKGCQITIHDPYVKKDDQNLLKYELEKYFTNDLDEGMKNSEYAFVCVAHREYLEQFDKIFRTDTSLQGVFDACNLYNRDEFDSTGIVYTGIGRGEIEPASDLVNVVFDGFRAMETGTANELMSLIVFFNERYADTGFNRVDFSEVQKLAASCSTGCIIPNYGEVRIENTVDGFRPRLVDFALNSLQAVTA